MLTMTATAADAVKTIVARTPDASGGIRISDEQGDQRGFALSVAPSPQPDDTIVDAQGARVFLDASAAAALDELVLDAEMLADGSVSFALAPQA